MSEEQEPSARSRSRLRNRGGQTARRAGVPCHGRARKATLSNRGRKLQRRKRITQTRRSLW